MHGPNVGCRRVDRRTQLLPTPCPPPRPLETISSTYHLARRRVAWWRSPRRTLRSMHGGWDDSAQAPKPSALPRAWRGATAGRATSERAGQLQVMHAAVNWALPGPSARRRFFFVKENAQKDSTRCAGSGMAAMVLADATELGRGGRRAGRWRKIDAAVRRSIRRGESTPDRLTNMRNLSRPRSIARKRTG